MDRVREADAPQHLEDALLHRVARHAEHLQGDRDVLADSAIGQKLEVLEDDAQVPPQKRNGFGLQARQILTADEYLAARWLLGGEHQSQER